MIPNRFQCATSPTRNIRSITHDVRPLVQNLIFQYTNLVHFELNLILYIPYLFLENI